MLVEETCLFSLSFLYASKQTFFHSALIILLAVLCILTNFGFLKNLLWIENNPYKAECSKLVLVGLKVLFGTTLAVYERWQKSKTLIKKQQPCVFWDGVNGNKTMSPSHLSWQWCIVHTMSVPASSDVYHFTYREK